MIRSAVFDSKLLEMGDWDKATLALLREWNETEDYTEKRLRASALIPVLIEATMGSQLTQDGKVRSKCIGKALMYFEDLLLTSKSGLGKKFYRDHLNHMIRVTILARVIAKLCFKREGKSETIAALFHDLGYPVAESRSIVEGSVDALQLCYKSVQFPRHFYQYDKEKASRLVRLLEPYDGSYQLGKALESHEHSAIGGMEFLDYVIEAEKYVSVLEAIVFHDSSFDRKISITESPVLAILVLADELQDWGRPIGFEKVSAVESIADFELGESVIRGHIQVAKDTPSFSPLRQIVSKVRNLGRLNLDVPLKFELEFSLPEYLEIPFRALEDLTTKLAKMRSGQGYDIAEKLQFEEEVSVFHKAYYGVPISDETNKVTIERLQAMDGSPIVGGRLLFASERNELLQLDEVGNPEAFVISPSDNTLSLHLRSSSGAHSGELSDVANSATELEAEKVVSVIRAFNVMLRCDANGTKSFRELYEFLPDPGQVLTILTKLGLPTEGKDTLMMLRSIRSSIQQRGFFRFSSS